MGQIERQWQTFIIDIPLSLLIGLVGFVVGTSVNNAVLAVGNHTAWPTFTEPSFEIIPLVFAICCGVGTLIKMSSMRKKRRQQQGYPTSMGMPEE